MDMSYVNVLDKAGDLSRSMTVKGNNKIVKVDFWISRVVSEIAFFSAILRL